MMKKIFALALVLILIVSLCACNNEQLPNDGDNQQQTQGNQLLSDGDVINIDISSLPEGYKYAFSGEDAKAITDYLSTLNLEGSFEENPIEYSGRTWVISLKYENGDTLTIYHFANMFIRSEKGSWYRMTYEEASRFDTLLNELNN